VLRLEDTDPERSTAENETSIIEALEWLELDWDEGPIRQSEREQRHREAVSELLESGRAYRDTATAEQVKEWKQANGAGNGYRGSPSDSPDAAVRLRVPDSGETVVRDRIHGDVSFPNASTDDFVIARADGSALYNLAVAVDDMDMEISDVIRGDDHLSNTPKQQMLIEALGGTVPGYAHLPLLHGPDGRKLSKRHGADSVQAVRDVGYLPAAVRNYLALLGWGTDDDTTLMSTHELLERFSLDRVGKAAAVFDEKKLRWVNGRYMRECPPEEYASAVWAFLGRAGDPDSDFVAACAIAQDKAQTLGEVWPLIAFCFEEPVDDPKAWRKQMKKGSESLLGSALGVLEEVDPFDAQQLEAGLEALVASEGIKAGRLYQPLRVAITGTSVSPGIFDSLAVLGKERSVARVRAAVSRLEREAGSAQQAGGGAP